MNRHEDKIKTYLHFLGDNEDLKSTSYDFKNKVNSFSRTRAYAGFEEFTDITDWQDQRDSTYYSASLPKLKSKEFRQQMHSMEMTSYKSSLLKESDRKRNEESTFISPVVIKFNPSNTNSTAKKSQLLYHRILHNEDGRKIENPEKLRSLLNRLHPREEMKKDSHSPPKTERCSGILRLLKRREQVRIYKKKKENPDALKGIKLH